MIELIFTIVIIGILAAVAIPKLTATRDDAKISNIVANARILSGDATSFYISQGAKVWSTALVNDVTDVLLYTDAACTTTVAAANTIIGDLYLCDESSGDDCIHFDINATAMTITAAEAGTSTICDGVVGDPAIIGMTGGAGNSKATTLGGVSVVR